MRTEQLYPVLFIHIYPWQVAMQANLHWQPSPQTDDLYSTCLKIRKCKLHVATPHCGQTLLLWCYRLTLSVPCFDFLWNMLTAFLSCCVSLNMVLKSAKWTKDCEIIEKDWIFSNQWNKWQTGIERGDGRWSFYVCKMVTLINPQRTAKGCNGTSLL